MEPNAVVELRNVSIYHTRDSFKEASFRKKRDNCDLVLSDVNLTVRPGELPLVEGEGWVAGFDLTKIRRKDIPYLRRRMGIVFQDYQLLTDRNVFQNLQFVLKATGWKNDMEIKNKIAEVLNEVGLVNKEYKMPFQLSGGEQQRLSIARALLNNPQVILADEPTGNLDPAASDGIMQLFRAIAGNGCAVIMATHNIGNIQQYPSRTIRFNQGQIEEIDIVSILGY